MTLHRSHHGDGSRGMSDLEHIIKAMVSFVRYKGEQIPYSGKLSWILRPSVKVFSAKFGGVLHPPMIGFKQSVIVLSMKFSLPTDP